MFQGMLILLEWDCIIYILKGHSSEFQNNDFFINNPCRLFNNLTNGTDPDEMTHSVAFHLCLYRLPR